MTIKVSVDSVKFYRPVYRLTTKCYDSYMAYMLQVIGLVYCILVLDDSPAFEFCADVSEYAVPSS
jgi:hypothetical protein